MKVALVGAELEENLGLRYMASSLEKEGHQTRIILFNSPSDIPQSVGKVIEFDPEITGLSMVFTNRALEFCQLSEHLRSQGYRKHIIAGGSFASFNAKNLLRDYSSFDSIAIGEGEITICKLAAEPDRYRDIPGLAYRSEAGSIKCNSSTDHIDDLDSLPFPKRDSFHEYFSQPIASILSSRGCWRSCAFCSINAWYRRTGGKRFRIRSIENIVEEMQQLYSQYNIRIFNFQDDNFFLPGKKKALQRFVDLRSALKGARVENIAIAIKARPDSITRESVEVLDDLGLFRVFLGVENASENGLRNLNRKSDIEEIHKSLRILNDFDIHVAYNLLMFEPDASIEDIRINLRFMENNINNPFNFCRAEVHAGTGMEVSLNAEGGLLGDYFRLDYRIKNPQVEAFHQIVNYAFFDRNFSDDGLHYFNMQVDFYFQLLRRFHPHVLSQHLRSKVRNFIKETNLDTYEILSEIFDYVNLIDLNDQVGIRGYARYMRECIDQRSEYLRKQGEAILAWLDDSFDSRLSREGSTSDQPTLTSLPYFGCRPLNAETNRESNATGKRRNAGWENLASIFGMPSRPIPYEIFKNQLAGKK